MANEEHNQRRQQSELSTNKDASAAGDTSERPRHDELPETLKFWKQ